MFGVFYITQKLIFVISISKRSSEVPSSVHPPDPDSFLSFSSFQFPFSGSESILS